MNADTDKSVESYVIRTTRLTLRPPDENDVDGLWPHVTNSEITAYLAWEPHKDKTVTANLIKSLQHAQRCNNGYHWIITRDDTIIGIVSLIDVKRRHLSWTLDRAEIAYWVAPAYQRSGYAYEACHAVLNFAFSELGLYKIRVAHAAENAASERLSNKLGFRKYAVERKAFQKNNHWHELVWYDLLRSEMPVADNEDL